MELQTGIPLFSQQFYALIQKHALVTWRKKASTLFGIFCPLITLVLFIMVDWTMDLARGEVPPNYMETRDPPLVEGPPIPPCEEKFYIVKPCYDFVWSGNNNPKIKQIISRIMANNPGRVIPDSKVKAFETPEQVDKWLGGEDMSCPGALHLREVNSSTISYGIQTNSTSKKWKWMEEDPTFKFQIPLQIAAEREIFRFLVGDPNFKWNVGFKSYPHPKLSLEIEKGSLFTKMGPGLLGIICSLPYVFQVHALVLEKESKLRQAMNTVGLYDSAYWLSWLIWESSILVVSSLATVLCGMMFKYDFFTVNSFMVLLLAFFLYQFNMINYMRKIIVIILVNFGLIILSIYTKQLGFAFFMSTLFGQASNTTVCTFIPLASPILKFYTEVAKGYKLQLTYLYPGVLGYMSFDLLAAATDGIDLSRLDICPNSSEQDGGEPKCKLTMKYVLLRMVLNFLMWVVLGLYLDNILPSVNGPRKPPYYFLLPGYWTGKDSGTQGNYSMAEIQSIIPDDEDVIAEEKIVKEQMNSGSMDPNVAVQVQGLQKFYYGGLVPMIKSFLGLKPDLFFAVKGTWINFNKDELLCLLGPNGAGKTTTISCLTGIASVTGGDAIVYGNSIRSPIGMSNVRKLMGICPQFDVLWRELSGEQQVELFAKIKGIPPDEIESTIHHTLEQVGLTKFGKQRAGSYSGGMRRRLSCAIALLGDPKLVIMDEPTTGMDPISRRQVWDIIEKAKKGRAIILTTHSMEEADVLADRVGIMAKGRLRCIGTSIRLKSKFGSGYVANLSFDTDTDNSRTQEATKQFFKQKLDISSKEENNSFLTYHIPNEKEPQLKAFFAELEARDKEFGILDIQLSLTTLEEVFLNIAARAELEASLLTGRTEPLTLPSGIIVEVPIGARYVGVPGTESSEFPRGIMVEVFWEQDPNGTFMISSHSDQMAIPAGVDTTTPNQSTSEQKEGVLGFVINENQIQDLTSRR